MRREGGETLSAGARRLTTAVAAVAMFTAVSAMGAGELTPAALAAALAGSTLVTLLAGWLGGRTKPARVAAWAAPLVGLAYVGSIAAEPLVRLAGYGRPLEIILLEALLATLPALAFAGGLRRWSPLCGTASLFAVLFAACLLGSGPVASLSACWAALAAVWLTVLVRDLSGGVAMTAERRRFAWTPVIGVAVLAGVVAAATAGRDSLSMKNGFLASSGGDGDGSDHARDGVGDGSALVAATKHAESFGPIEDAPFARSDEPSLYDMFDENFGEPLVTKKQDRAISLSPEEVLEGEKEMAEAEAAGREFSTLRKPRVADRGGVDDISSAAVLYVAGRVPLHLRVQTLELFDGVTWRPEPAGKLPDVELATAGGDAWLTAPRPSAAFEPLFSEPEAHAVKPVHYDESRIPAPPHLTAVHVDRIDRPDFYEWASKDVPRLKRKRLAKLVPVHLASRRLDEDLIDAELPHIASGGRHELHALPTHPESGRIRDLAKQWAAGTEPGWTQVRQVLDRLREHATLDRDAVADPDSDFPAADFLFEARRGPEYQFATAGCLLLRSLGYPSRLVTGFYADAEKYDFAGRHTPVEVEDAHVWCEVQLSAGLWATVDPSPGYVVLGPPRSLWYRLKRAAAAGARRALAMWPVWLAIAVAAALTWRRRVEVADRLRTLRWRLRGGGGVDAWRVVSRRLDVVQGPPPGWTAAKRIEQLDAPADVKRRLSELAGGVEVQMFAGDEADLRGGETAVREVTLRNLRGWRLAAETEGGVNR